MSAQRKDLTRPLAVALRHERGTGAPRVTAKGTGEVARRITELAEQHGVPVERDADLLQLLAACELGEEIPEELYRTVAELLAFLYRLNA